MRQDNGFLDIPQGYSVASRQTPMGKEWTVEGNTACVVVKNGVRPGLDGEARFSKTAREVMEALNYPYGRAAGNDLLLFVTTDFGKVDFDSHVMVSDNVAEGVRIHMNGLPGGDGSFKPGLPVGEPCTGLKHIGGSQMLAFFSRWMVRGQKRRGLSRREYYVIEARRSLNDERLLQEMKASEEGEKWRAVFEEEDGWRGEYGNVSKTALQSVFPLAVDLLYWTGPDVERVMGLVRKTAFHRDDWDGKYDRYLEGLVTAAINFRKNGEYWSPIEKEDIPMKMDVSWETFKKMMESCGIELNYNVVSNSVSVANVSGLSMSEGLSKKAIKSQLEAILRN